MGYGIVPHKGEPTMCEQPCDHKDCKLWREFFTSKCELCGKPFEEGQQYYQAASGHKLEDGKRWAHAACEDERIEKERKAFVESQLIDLTEEEDREVFSMPDERDCGGE